MCCTAAFDHDCMVLLFLSGHDFSVHDARTMLTFVRVFFHLRSPFSIRGASKKLLNRATRIDASSYWQRLEGGTRCKEGTSRASCCAQNQYHQRHAGAWQLGSFNALGGLDMRDDND